MRFITPLPGAGAGAGAVAVAAAAAAVVVALLPTVAAQTDANSTTAFDVEAWNGETSALCAAKLSQLERASNPSGTSVCYNIAMLNSQTGRFVADLRLFKISEPTDDFLGIPGQNIQVGLAYSGATASLISETDLQSDGVITRRQFPMAPDMVAARRLDGGLYKRSNPEPLQHYLFKGQIDEARMSDDVVMTELVVEALVIPTLTLSATNGLGQQVATNVSSNEASFLIGTFADSIFQSDFSLANDAVEEQTARLKAGEIAFVLPGVQLMIFPTGLVVTSIWMVIGLSTYGFGTYERFRHRENFRSRQALLKKTTGQI